MKTKAPGANPFKILIITCALLFFLLIALSPFNLFLEELSSSLILPFYYLTRLVGYSVYFISFHELISQLRKAKYENVLFSS